MECTRDDDFAVWAPTSQVLDPFRALTLDCYQTMQLVEDLLVEMTGGNLSTPRYYFLGEATDDPAVVVLEEAGLPADGNADFLLRSLKLDMSSALWRSLPPVSAAIWPSSHQYSLLTSVAWSLPVVEAHEPAEAPPARPRHTIGPGR